MGSSQDKSMDSSDMQSGDIVNDFSLTFSTVNGSGSATANTTILRAIFRMGIPVSGKNIFPSNIQGLPTWYTIRVSKHGYTGRVEQDDIVVAMNQVSILEDIRFLIPKEFYSIQMTLISHRSRKRLQLIRCRSNPWQKKWKHPRDCEITFQT